MLSEIVAAEAGAVVKTIGDAVMATFPTPDRALAAALAHARLGARTSRNGDLLIKIGIHEGPCLAVTLNDRLDYFGQTVNIAARVQGLADERAIFATKPVVEHPQVAKMIGDGQADADRAARRAARRRRQDGGVSDSVAYDFHSVATRARAVARFELAVARSRLGEREDSARQNFIQSPDFSNAALAR